jgi:hypothetical protein
LALWLALARGLPVLFALTLFGAAGAAAEPGILVNPFVPPWPAPFALAGLLTSSSSDPDGQARFSLVQRLSQGAPIPEEPAEYDQREVEAYYDWRNDLFFRRFDMAGTGVTDFMTARRTYRVWLNEFGTPVVVTMSNPLFYWVDLNRNGELEPGQGEMWSDPEEDGVNGNERPYDVHSPPSREPAVGARPEATPGKGHRPLPDPRRWR